MSPLPCPVERRGGFTLVELLVVVAVIAILAGLLLPALGRAEQRARQVRCLGQLRQIGLAWQLYLTDHSDRFPDRRDLKRSLPGGWRPWSGWPRSDPRSGWAAVVLGSLLPSRGVWRCPGGFRNETPAPAPLEQALEEGPGSPRIGYWHWRFDQAGEEVPLDNFWGKSSGQCVEDLRRADNPFIGRPSGPSGVELVADAYFPSTAAGVPEGLSGRGAHGRQVNRVFLDGHAAAARDARLRP